MILCHSCKERLPLADAEADDLASWACRKCGAVYRASIDSRSTEQERKRVLLVQRTYGRIRGRERQRL
jgi:hypothetical protein